MAKLNARGVYRLANQAFKDDNDLATFNLIYEVSNGELRTLDPEDLRTDEMQLIGVIGRVLLIDDYAAINIRGDDPHALLDRMKTLILGLTDETDEEQVVIQEISLDFPTTLAAVGAWMTPDGSIKLVVYNHPEVPPHRAAVMLKKLLAELETREASSDKPGAVGAN